MQGARALHPRGVACYSKCVRLRSQTPSSRAPPGVAPLVGLLLLSVSISPLLACARGPYDPAKDAKIPRPPKTITWEHEAILDATPEEAWGVYLDFARYPQWNPFILEATPRAPPDEASPSRGDIVDIRVALGDKTRDMWHLIYELQPPTRDRPGRFCWRDGGPSTAFVTGARCRSFAAHGDGQTRFRQLLIVGGGSRELARRRYGAILQDSLQRETEALQAELARPRAPQSHEG